MTKIKMISSESQAFHSVGRLARERPDWLPVLRAAAAVASESERYGGEFAGAWVVKKLSEGGGPRWIPNLRILAGYGLVEKSGPSTRSGRRAYYRMPHRVEIERALEAWDVDEDKPRSLSFVASAASSERSDIARRAGEIAYEPRSWR